jgi:hypothetical protein
MYALIALGYILHSVLGYLLQEQGWRSSCGLAGFRIETLANGGIISI